MSDNNAVAVLKYGNHSIDGCHSFVATYSIKINSFGGYVHLGDSGAFISLAFGKKKVQ